MQLPWNDTLLQSESVSTITRRRFLQENNATIVSTTGHYGLDGPANQHV
jgi:hypothetical protein